MKQSLLLDIVLTPFPVRAQRCCAQQVVPKCYGESALMCLQSAATGSTGAADGVCNEMLPNTDVYTRFLYVVHSLAANGFYVVIDNHLSFDATAATNPSQWVAMWAQLLGDIVADPVAKGRVMVDLLNEPDARGFRCFAQKWRLGATHTAWTHEQLAVSTLQAQHH